MPIRKSVATARRLCLLVPVFCASFSVAQVPASTTAPAATDSAQPKVLEPFEVTGSRVKRLDYETVSPVVTFSSANIEEKGYATLG